jgi:hypothetical protein
VGNLLRLIPGAVRQATLMGFVGRSQLPGRPPAWLTSATDIRFVGYDGASGGDTVLHFEAPRLGEAAEVQYQQQEFWPTKPPAEDTGFDLLGDVIADVAAHRTDSERFDLALLKRIRDFSRALDRNYDRFSLAGHRFTEAAPAVVDQKTLENARLLESETPLPQKVRISGVLDMIRRSSQGFELVLDDGMKVRGVLIEGEMDSLKPLFGQRVLVQGTAVYRPSGRPLRIDAGLVEPSGVDSGLWAAFPPPRRRKLDTKLLLKPQSAKTGVSAFYGTWPGDETDEEWNEIVEGLD